MTFIIDFGITALVFLPVFSLVYFLLWRLKSKGPYTVLLGIAILIVIEQLGFLILPRAVTYHHGPGGSPVQMGIMLGCGVPMFFMLNYYHKHRMQRKAHKPTT